MQALAFAAAAGVSFGAEATFDINGRIVYAATGAPALAVLDIENYTSSTLNLEKNVGAPIHFVSLSSSGFILLGTQRRIFAFDPVKSKCVRVCDAPEGAAIEDIAYDWKTGSTFLLARTQSKSGADVFGVEAIPKDETRTGSIFTRRVPYIQGLVFDDDGQLYFGARGDLWHGSIEWENDETEEYEQAMDSKLGGVNIGALVGYRCAPLATHETHLGTPMEMGVQSVAVSDGMLYAHVLRMGGSGWGNVVRFRKPAPFSEDSLGDLKRRVEIYQQSLGTLEMLGENGRTAMLCASRDGQRVFFKTETDGEVAFWLVENDETPRQIELEEQ